MKYVRLVAVLLAGLGLAVRLAEEAVGIWVRSKTRSDDVVYV